MKKRLMIYMIVIVITLVLSIVYKDLGEEGIFLLYAPFLVIKDILANLSLSSSLGNFFAWIILLMISSIPLGIGMLVMKKKMKLFDVLCLTVLSISLGYVFYVMINMQDIASWNEAIVFFQSEHDIRPVIAYGILNVWFGILLFYVVIKMFVIKKEFGRTFLYLMICLMCFVLVLTVQSMTSSSFEGVGISRNLYNIEWLFNLVITISTLILSELMITMIDLFRKKEYKEKLLSLAKLIHMTTLMIIVASLAKMMILNFYQLIYLNELTHRAFDFSIDLFAWLFVFFFYGLYHYITDAKEMMEEAELTI